MYQWKVVYDSGETLTEEDVQSIAKLDPQKVVSLTLSRPGQIPFILLVDRSQDERFIKFTRVSKTTLSEMRVEVLGIQKLAGGVSAKFFLYIHPESVIISTSPDIYFSASTSDSRK